MRNSTVVLSIVLGAICGAVVAHDSKPSVSAGEVVIVNLGGELAIAHARLTKSIRDHDRTHGMRVQVVGKTHRVEGGRIEVRSEIVTKQKGQKDRMIVLSAVVEPSQIQTVTIPKGTVTYNAPDAQKAGAQGNVSQTPARQLELTLNETKAVTLRSWTAEQ